MIAPLHVQPGRRISAPQPTPRDATKRRKAAHLKRRYRDCLSIGLISAAIVLSVVGYLVLITRSTSLDDRLMHAQAQQAQLQEDLVMLEDRRAQLEARDRLSQIAARLGFKEHPQMLIITVPAQDAAAPSSPQLFGTVAGWLHLK